MNIDLDIGREENFTQNFLQNSQENHKLTDNNKIQNLISVQNKQNSKLLIPASNFSNYSRDITNRLTLSSINKNLSNILYD